MLNISFSLSLFIIASFFFIHWYASLFMQSFFHHRYAAHMQFSINIFWERIFYIISYFTQGSSYLSPRAYALMHRLHHAHADTEKDPHSPIFTNRLDKMMWKTKQMYAGIFRDRISVEEKFKVKVPDWKWMDNLGHSFWSRLFWMLAYTTFYVFFATQWWMFLLLPFHFFMGAFHGAIINWFAHKIGYINYPLNNTSRNLVNIDLLMWGESLHNNHHKYPGRANFATKWFEWDPMYPFIRLLDTVKIIRLKPLVVNR
ncbi:MAG: fatty acid desaturase [Salibacteraceae bacterium]